MSLSGGLKGLVLSMLLAPWAVATAQVVNGSFEVDHWPPGEPTGWPGGTLMGQPIGTPLIWVPGGIFGNIQVPMASVIGKDGACSLGVRGGSTASQSVPVTAGRAYELSYWAQTMNLTGLKNRLRTRLLDVDGTVLAEAVQVPGLGGAGPTGFQKFSLYVGPVSTNRVTVAFENLETDSAQTVAIDVVALNAVPSRTPPALTVPKRSGTGWTLTWVNTDPVQLPQTAPSPNGPWTDVPTQGVTLQDGIWHLDMAAQPDGATLFFRTHD